MLNRYITILVRGKKDRDVIEHVVDRYYTDWRGLISIETFTERSIDRLVDRIRELLKNVNSSGYILTILGRDDIANGDVKDLEYVYKYPNISILKVRTSKVRNMRPLELFVNIEKCKADIRLRVSWLRNTSTYVLGYLNNLRDVHVKIIENIHPLYDVYLVFGNEAIRNIEHIINKDLDTNTLLIVKRLHDEHDVYIGDRKFCRLAIPENDEPYVKYIKDTLSNVYVNLKDGIELSYNFLKIHENIAINLIRSVFEVSNFDRVVVPWSGGKDSTACLILSIKALGKDLVTPIFVDMGLEFDLNRMYVEYVSDLLHVDVEIGHVDLLSELSRRELPSHEFRWCTKLKIRELYRIMKKISDKPLVVVGDRDTESLLRLKRAPVRKHEWITQVAPLKFWSSIMVQYYLLLNKVPINPLYMLGFYRLGCYICPAYRIYELNLAEKVLKIDNYETFYNILKEQSYLIY